METCYFIRNPPRPELKPVPWKVPNDIDDEKYGEFGRYRSHLYHAHITDAEFSLSDTLGFFHLMRMNPNHCGFVELGTREGQTTLLFAAVMAVRGCEVYSFDHIEKRPKTVLEAWPENANFYSADCIQASTHITEKGKAFEGKKLIVESIKKSKFHFFDNGMKPLEFEMYAPYVEKGEFITTHDWDFDIDDKFLRPLLEEGVVKYWDCHFYDTINAKMRVFIKMKDAIDWDEEEERRKLGMPIPVPEEEEIEEIEEGEEEAR